ncbi:MAG: (2Fe-2S)-binding protein [Gammaproteobacteria bacterium]|nr:(2Fe-2S)-binding protein [Gammaproteobacteria bacterium]MDH4254910.1 (2Fe-2S)-binding protein [Gammaproteobacteria bacterium]MDH5309905.1 (2Fe-2S)-binding protein [Gammaproteobacteria bacterium]
MYVCICKSVTDRDIRRAVASGVMTLDELRNALGVASGCGTCADTAQIILFEASSRRVDPVVYAPSAA